MSKQCKWTFSSDEENFCNDEYDTKEEAIATGKEYYDGDTFYVGRIEQPGLGVRVDVTSILEYINDCAMDEYGEGAEDYLMDTKQEHDNQLENELCDVIIKWIERHGYQPTFFKVVNIESVECGDGAI